MKLAKLLRNTLFSLTVLWLGFVIAWQILSVQNFHYGFWYQQLNIKEHIERYAPQNRKGKRDFINTSASEHEELFAQVVSAVNQQGQGLKDIRYQGRNQQAKKLFTQAESIHLQDVANLIDALAAPSWIAFIIFALLFVYMLRQRLTLVRFRYHCFYGLSTVLFLTVIIILLGAKAIFYWLHIQIFPEDHQWFFLYQDSLMATFMKAPDLFGPIAASWVILSLVFWALILFLSSFLLHRNA